MDNLNRWWATLILKWAQTGAREGSHGAPNLSVPAAAATP